MGENIQLNELIPPGKWFFYEQILKVPIYIIFDQNGGLLEFYQLENGRYELQQPNSDGLHWIDSMSFIFRDLARNKRSENGLLVALVG